MSRTRFLQDILESVFTRESRGGVVDPFADGAHEQPLEALCDALLTERGEVSGNRIAAAVLGRLRGAEPSVERGFFDLLATRYDLDAQDAVRAAEAYAASPDAARLEALVGCVEPRRQELLRRLNRYPGATGELVRLRARLHAHARGKVDASGQGDDGGGALERVDVDFRHLFRSWFNRGFLVLREIDWATPANVLEKIIEYEAVHAIGSWDALRARLEPDDRRCYAFFHPAMPDEPLIFVEVALVREAPATVREVLAPGREVLAAEDADTAVFYSISNCQKGLAGISFGNSLIKRVAAELKASLPNLERFRTLSPVPGLMRWVESLAGDRSGEGGGAVGAGAVPDDDDGAVSSEALALARDLATGTAEPPDETGRRALARLVAHYLVVAKRGDGTPLDPVARFHLGNGASLDAVLPEADVFDKGRRQSAGAMVSYLYDLSRVAAHHEAYASGREIALSGDVRALLAPPRRQRRRAS